MKRKDYETALEQSGMTANAISVAKAYASHATYKDDPCLVWPGVKRIAAKTGLALRTVKKYRKALIVNGWLPPTGNRHYQDGQPVDELELCEGSVEGDLVKQTNQNSLANLNTYNAERKREAEAKKAFLAKALAEFEASQGGANISDNDAERQQPNRSYMSDEDAGSQQGGWLTVRPKEPINNQYEEPYEEQHGSDLSDVKEDSSSERSEVSPTTTLDHSEGSNSLASSLDSPEGTTRTEGANSAYRRTHVDWCEKPYCDYPACKAKRADNPSVGDGW